jgi:hypothetical protein
MKTLLRKTVRCNPIAPTRDFSDGVVEGLIAQRFRLRGAIRLHLTNFKAQSEMAQPTDQFSHRSKHAFLGTSSNRAPPALDRELVRF